MIACFARPQRVTRVLFAALVLALLAPVGLPATTGPVEAARANDYVPISGGGSSWSANAVDQWRRNVQQFGLRVNYASTGSVDGRNQFKAGTVDYAVSETPYGLTDNGVLDALPSRPFAYMPIVAGGTAFMYNLRAGGQPITNLRLSGDTVSKIFTGVITTWDDPAIAADNPGLALPARRIVPVVRSDGSGSTAQFTGWMAAQHRSIWDAYCKKVGRSTPCGQTSNYPTLAGAGFVAQPNSQGVSGYVAQRANEGTITYVEYSYALKTGYPVAKVLNKAGYYVEPTASNVAVGLLGATINQDRTSPAYLTQNLSGVYNNADKRAYPLSSYSYMIVPTATSGSFTDDRGRSLAAFANYVLCEGQQQAEVLGYSPLPINLAKAGLDQVRRIPGANTKSIDIKKCNNPTFSSDGTNTLAARAPQPSECDKKGVTQCSDGTGGAKETDTPPAAGGSGSGGASGGGSTSGGSEADGTGGGDGSGDSGDAGSGDDGTSEGDPFTETPGESGFTGGIGAGGGTGVTVGGPVACDDDTGQCSSIRAIPVSAPSADGWEPIDWAVLAVALVAILAVVVPPLLVTGAARGGRR